MPADVPAKKLKSILNDKIPKVALTLGHSLYRKIWKKTSVKDGHLVTEEVKIEGRKIKLLEIWQKMLDMQKKYNLFHTDDEIGNMDRHTMLMFLQKHKSRLQWKRFNNIKWASGKIEKSWENKIPHVLADGLTLSKHSHIMMMVTCIYDEAAFLTNDEFEAINGTPVNIQPLIEKPLIIWQNVHLMIINYYTVQNNWMT